jgi:hypothetical protein
VGLRIFHDNTEPGVPDLVIRLTKNPRTGLVHRDESVHSFRRTHLDHVYLARHRNRVPVEADHFEIVTGKGDAVLIGSAGIQDAKENLLTFLDANWVA